MQDGQDFQYLIGPNLLRPILAIFDFLATPSVLYLVSLSGSILIRAHTVTNVNSSHPKPLTHRTIFDTQTENLFAHRSPNMDTLPKLMVVLGKLPPECTTAIFTHVFNEPNIVLRARHHVFHEERTGLSCMPGSIPGALLTSWAFYWMARPILLRRTMITMHTRRSNELRDSVWGRSQVTAVIQQILIGYQFLDYHDFVGLARLKYVCIDMVSPVTVPRPTLDEVMGRRCGPIMANEKGWRVAKSPEFDSAIVERLRPVDTKVSRFVQQNKLSNSLEFYCSYNVKVMPGYIEVRSENQFCLMASH